MKKTFVLIGSKLAANWKIIFWLTLSLLLLFSVTPRGYAQALESASEQQTFPYKKRVIVSSYYSPRPGQLHYFTGTYEGDVRLNGEGDHSADGTFVYPGMAAAPSGVPFGTKIDVPGFGIVAIHDRGGAIKNNRLDIWVGEGEEGLQRALGWGMRTLEVTVYGVDPNIQESVNFSAVPNANLDAILLKTKYFRSDLGYGDEGASVRELQRFLKEFGYFESDITGYFGDQTEEALKKFQIETKVIDSLDDSGAGNFGPRSRVALESMLDDKKTEALKKVPEPTLKRGDSGMKVRSLQTVLKQYGYYTGEVNGIFNEQTFDALLRLQMDFELISKKTDVGAGFYGPKTKSVIDDLIKTKFSPGTALLTPTPITGSEGSKAMFDKELKLGDKGEDVIVLQEELNRLNFLKLAPTGYFGQTTKHAVFKFQQAFSIVQDEKSDGAGIAGPRTLAKLNEISSARNSQKKEITVTTETKQMVAQRVSDESSLVAGIISPSEVFDADLIVGGRGSEVEKLQKILKRLGFFPGRLTTEYFGSITKNSLLAFQKSHGLEMSGALDQKTRKILNQIISESQSS